MKSGILKALSLAVLILVMAVPGFAQKVATGVMSPVPLWPPDGNIPDDMKDQFVFLDLSKGQVVVSYPDPQAPGGRVMLRFDRHDQAEPIIASAVALEEGGLYRYEYTIRNGISAKKKLKNWSLLVGSGAGLKATHAVWNASSESSPGSQPGSIRPELLLKWSAPSAGEIERGDGRAGFELRSTLKPGLTIAFAQSVALSEYTDAVAPKLPKAVVEQLSKVINIHWDTSQAMTVGPKFAPQDPIKLIALDFHRALNKLSVLGPLKADSPFVAGALRELTSFIQTPIETSLRLDFLNRAAPGLESEIAAAMKLSLQ